VNIKARNQAQADAGGFESAGRFGRLGLPPRRLLCQLYGTHPVARLFLRIRTRLQQRLHGVKVTLACRRQGLGIDSGRRIQGLGFRIKG
jgi:hypothetical protein